MWEGWRLEIVDGLARVITATPGVRLLDRTSDPDHNRSVFTFAGDADAVESAALALIDATYSAIDMRAHKGEHPRLGAVDVVPFVPLAGATRQDCVAMAHRVGAAVAAKHQVPVFYYANAATRPDRVRLPDILKPEYAGLPAFLETTPVPGRCPGPLLPPAC